MKLAVSVFAFVLTIALNSVFAASMISIASFDDLNGWGDDNHYAEPSVFQNTGRDIDDAEWQRRCAYAVLDLHCKVFFELPLQAVLTDGSQDALFTEYFEPKLEAAYTKNETCKFAIYRLPPDLPAGQSWFSRPEIETQGLLGGQDLETTSILGPVHAFALRIKGFGSISLKEGGVSRSGSGGKSCYRCKSVGQELLRRGVREPHERYARVAQNWIHADLQKGTRISPSFVFFRKVNDVPPDEAPLGAMNRSIIKVRFIPLDPSYIAFAARLWIEKASRSNLHRLMVAQATGSVVKNPQHADFFYGTGQATGLTAGGIRDEGRIAVLRPTQLLHALVPGE